MQLGFEADNCQEGPAVDDPRGLQQVMVVNKSVLSAGIQFLGAVPAQW